MFKQDDKVYEITDPGIFPVAEVAEHGVELLGRVAVDVDDLDHRRRDPGELERVRQDHMVGCRKFVGAWRNI